jgi:hypothetical protein
MEGNVTSWGQNYTVSGKCLFFFFGHWIRNLCKMFREDFFSELHHFEDGSSMFL